MFWDFNYFHDAFMKEASFFTTAYIDQEGVWYGDCDPCNARLLFQSQSPEVRCLELVFINVEKISMCFNCDLTPKGKIVSKKIELSFMAEPCERDFMIITKQLKYRIFSSHETINGMPPNGETYLDWVKAQRWN